MSNVRSSQGLTVELLKAGVTPESAAAGSTATAEGKAPAATAAEDAPPRPIAIVGVHGISPIQQYGFQDQLATGLLGYLNAVEQAASSGRKWTATPYWPREANDEKTPVLKPSALRLHCDDEPDPENPRGRVYDVYEGYWSPYSKGKTNIAKLLAWLLNCTFLATSSTAKIPASWASWDGISATSSARCSWWSSVSRSHSPRALSRGASFSRCLETRPARGRSSTSPPFSRSCCSR